MMQQGEKLEEMDQGQEFSSLFSCQQSRAFFIRTCHQQGSHSQRILKSASLAFWCKWQLLCAAGSRPQRATLDLEVPRQHCAFGSKGRSLLGDKIASTQNRLSSNGLRSICSSLPEPSNRIDPTYFFECFTFYEQIFCSSSLSEQGKKT